jgi:phosphoserine phosphatase RsbU/P
MVDKSIAYRLSLYISLAVIAIFAAILIVFFLSNRKLIRESTENNAIGLSAEVNSLVNMRVITIQEVAHNVASQILYYSQNGDAEKLLFPVIQKYPFLNTIIVTIDTNLNLPYHYIYIQHNEENYVFEQNYHPVYQSPAEKKVLEGVSEMNSSGWTEPSFCQNKGIIVVYYIAPIKSEKGFSGGFVICEMSLSELSKAINQLEIENRGSAFVVDNSGGFITYPDESRIFDKNLLDPPPKTWRKRSVDLKRVLTNGQAGSAIAWPEFLNHEKSWIHFSPIADTQWFLIFIMPYHELFENLYWMTFRMLVFALLGILFLYYLIAYITRKQIKPLSIVTSRLTSFSSPIRLTTKNEVKQVANSLEYLKVWFEQYQIAREEIETSSLLHKQDLQQASEIQQSLIKNTFPAFPDRNDIDLHALYKPAKVVSGDLFDYFFIDNENLVFTIGDVSGKGIPAAIFMSVAQTIIRKNAPEKKPKTIVGKTNIELCTSNNHLYFLTLFLGVLNLKEGTLRYCNAAHTFPYLLKPDGEVMELKSTHGLPLGLYSEKKYKDERVTLVAGDTIVLYTDGINDIHDSEGIQIGKKWLKDNLAELASSSPGEIIRTLDDRLETFKGKAVQNDDICLLAIKYMPQQKAR